MKQNPFLDALVIFGFVFIFGLFVGAIAQSRADKEEIRVYQLQAGIAGIDKCKPGTIGVTPNQYTSNFVH